jgi:hypothetical protein
MLSSLSFGWVGFGERGRNDFGLAVMGNLLCELNCWRHRTVSCDRNERESDDNHVLPLLRMKERSKP